MSDTRLLLGVMQTGGYAKPCLWVDFNTLGADLPEADIYGHTASWALSVGQSVVARDADGLKCDAVVCGPWTDPPEFVGLRLTGQYDYSECPS